MLWLVWLLWKPFAHKPDNANEAFISVLIPIRNEEQYILRLLQALAAQSLAKEQFEVLVLDDESTDRSPEIVAQFAKNTELNLKYIALKEQDRSLSPKKRAISEGINQARGEIIVCTDGDCHMGKNWLREIVHFFGKPQVVFASAPVFFEAQQDGTILNKIWTGIQQIEFCSLIVSGAVSIRLQSPNMCSGANIAYRKSAFIAVDGFEGNLHVASGDDEFLMHKIKAHYPNGVHYLKSKDAIVYTQALATLGSFYQQRRRWASKWTSYEQVAPKLLAMFIFSSNLAFMLAIAFLNWPLLFLKVVPEALFLSSVRFFSRKKSLLVLLPFVQIIYPFYVVLFGLSSLQKKEYIWKNRKLK